MLRLEQLYPFPEKVLAEELAGFRNAEIVWVQEEPKNQGAWTFVAPRIEATLDHMGRPATLPYIGRPEYASTAAGLMSQHTAELQTLLNEALSL
jgi:2-oxoglutarate dehydrogenase E1 component